MHKRSNSKEKKLFLNLHLPSPTTKCSIPSIPWSMPINKLKKTISKNETLPLKKGKENKQLLNLIKTQKILNNLNPNQKVRKKESPELM